ncbi:MAG: hypothetical protein AAB554_02120 [Patescibacteria group bacterium]
MRGFLTMCACLSLAGCFAGASQGRSTTAYVHDDGIHPVQRTTVSQSYSGSSVGGTVPIMMAGGGYGGGYGTMAGPSCVLHPDNCAVIQTATVIQPVTVASYGGYGGPGTYAESPDVADLEARIERLEAAVPKLAGATILSLRQSCMAIMQDTSVIKDEAERAKIVAGCEKVLKSNPSADAPSEEK